MSEHDFRLVDGKKLARGFTTGSCAAGAARAAACLLFTGQEPESIEVKLPEKGKIKLPLAFLAKKNSDRAEAGIIKDGGDDPDVTTGIEIRAEVSLIPPEKTAQEKEKIIIKGGEGVGRVTRPGLPVEVGEAAINPVPRKMIRENLQKYLPQAGGLEVTITVPAGEEIAEKTFNPDLGIEQGISILGTTGIVEPMSTEAYEKTIELKIKQLAEAGPKTLILVPGKMGENFVQQQLGLPGENIVQCSNYIGHALTASCHNDFTELLLVGHLGKLCKVAAGIFQTRNKVADARAEIMTAYAGLRGAGKELLEKIFQAKTTTDMAELLWNNGHQDLFPWLAQRIATRCQNYCEQDINLGVVIYNNQRGLLGEVNLAYYKSKLPG